MSQYYQLTSLDEIYRLYPNLQVDNVDSVQYMVQDDKIIQYTDAQGQQTLAAIDNGNMQFGQSPAVTPQGVFVIEAVETQQLDANRLATSSDQSQIPSEQLNPTVQPTQNIIETQQALVLKQLDQSGSELLLQKEVPNSETNSQCILQMDQNKPQIMNQQSQYVIHPIQANVVQVDSSKQQSNSLQTQYISQQQDVNNALKGSVMERTNKKDIQQLPIRQLEGNKGAIVGQINSLNNQQQILMQPIETPYRKAVVELGTQDRQLIMQQVDGGKQNSIIVQQLGPNNQFPNQILVNQVKPNKNQHALIQNIQLTQKESLKFQNVENPQFIMQKLDGSKQQQGHYQMQHFIVPQGERHQPKVVVQRLEINKQMASTPQLIVQQFQPVASNQGTQFVVQQLDLNKQQNILPYIFTTPAKQAVANETVQEGEPGKGDANGSQPAEQRFKAIEKEETLLVQFANNQGVPKTMNEGNNKQERRQGTISVGQEIKFPNQLQEQIVGRLNQTIQSGETNERQGNYQVDQLQNESQRRFVHQEIVQQNHVQRSIQEVVQQAELGGKARTPENSLTANGSEQRKAGETVQVQVQSQQPNQFVQNDVTETDNSLKGKQENSIQLDKAPAGVISMQSPVSTANLSQCRRITLKQNETESYPAGVFIIPRGENPMYIGQYQPGFRLQGTQTLSHTVVKQSGVDNKTKSNDKSSQTGDLSSQNVVVQREPPMLLTAACTDSQKNSNLTGLNQQKIPVRSPVKPGSLDQATIKAGDIMIASRVQQGSINRMPTTMVLTSEQTSDSAGKDGERREIVVQSYGNNNVSQPVTTLPSSPGQANLRTGKGRGTRPSLGTPNQRAMLPSSPNVRGVQVQTTLTRLPQTEIVTAVRKPKGVGNVTVGGWAPNAQDVRNQVGPRPIIYQLASVNSSNCASNASNINANNINVVNSATNMNINNSNNSVVQSDVSQCVENADETRMLVLLPNGERKLVRFPNTQQNIHINQLWQQVRFSLGSQISIVSNEQISEKTGTGQILIKGVAIENQETQPGHDPSNINQTSTSNIQIPGNVTSPTTVVAQQQRTRGVSPRLGNSPTGNGAFRSRTQCNVPRMPSPRVINQRMVTPPQHQQSQTIVTHNSSLPGAVTQVQPVKDGMTPAQHPKETPRFIPGQVAICPFCGISSLDFNKCIRCKRKLPPNVKSQSIFTAKKKKPEKASFSSEGSLDSTKLDSDDKNSETSNTENKEKTCSGVTDKKKPKPSPKKKKIADEPAEILILSSDEEEDNNQSKVETPRELPVLSKEPVFETMQLTAEEIAAVAKGTNLVDDLMENVQPGSYTTLLCRAVRIGSYKTQPKERLLISNKGVRLVVPSLKSENITIIIRCSEIRKILVHFGKQMPVIFIYVSRKMGYQIRSNLGMENKTGPYFDPTAQQDETHKRITFILEKLTEDNKVALNNMFSQSKLLEELSEKEANEILVRASPVDEQGVLLRPTDAVKKIMIYPPPPEKGGIPLNNQDYACLGEDQFLNDVIIDFYLKYLLLKVLSPEDRERTHVFSTFFYKRLTTKPKTLRKNDPENDPKLSPAEKRHLRVKGWTKQVNLFEKDFIIVPINEHSHWFLAIICFPGLNGPVKFSDNSPVEPEEVPQKKSTRTVQIGNTTITHIVKTDRSTLNVEMDPGSDRDEAEGDQDDLHPSSEDEESEQVEEEAQANSTQVEIPLLSSPPQSSPVQSKETKGKPIRKKTFKEPIKQPCILIFDSLAGASRVRVVATLRDYLKIEYKKKMGHDREFSKDTIKGAVPKVPQQNNFTDCGLYVLQYVESFFQDPLHDFKLPLRYLQDWFPEEVVSCKRQELACLIRSLMEEQGIKVDEIGLPNLTFANESNTGEEQAKLEEEEEEEGNGEEDEMEKSTAIASEIDNDEEEDMDIDEEEDDPEEGEEEEDEEVYEELELSEGHKQVVHFNSSCTSEMDAEDCQFTPTKCCRRPGFNASGSDEEQLCSEERTKIRGSENIIISRFHKVGEIEDRGGGNVLRKVHGSTEQKKSVPLTEYQDFESQITCTTIEKNVETLTSESDMIISEGDEEEETRIEVTNVENVILTETIGNLDGEEDDNDGMATIEFRDKLAKEKKVVDVTNVISKFSSENSVTGRRKDDVGIGGKLIKSNCDKKEGGEGGETKMNSPCVKRSFEALKSVRIPKKAERAVFLTKKQRIDET